MYPHFPLTKFKKLIGKDHLNSSVKKCREEIQLFVDTGVMPSPKYFEEVAFISRKERKYENEIAICEMYLELVSDYAITHKLTQSEVRKQIEPISTPIKKRILNAKTIMSKL